MCWHRVNSTASRRRAKSRLNLRRTPSITLQHDVRMPDYKTKDPMMTGTLNKALLIGHLGHDPDVRTMNSGEPVAHLSIATSEAWKNKSTGARREATEWHRVVLYKRLAELAGQHLRKGALVYIEGHLQTRKWTGKDGVERHTTEIVGDELRILHRPSEQKLQLAVHEDPPVERVFRQEQGAGRGTSVPF